MEPMRIVDFNPSAAERFLRAYHRSWCADHNARTMSFEEWMSKREKARDFWLYIDSGGADAIRQLDPKSEGMDELIGVLTRARRATGSDQAPVLDAWVRQQTDSIMGVAPLVAAPQTGDTVSAGPGQGFAKGGA